jgi:hypothetical protein
MRFIILPEKEKQQCRRDTDLTTNFSWGGDFFALAGFARSRAPELGTICRVRPGQILPGSRYLTTWNDLSRRRCLPKHCEMCGFSGHDKSECLALNLPKSVGTADWQRAMPAFHPAPCQ